MQESYFVSLKRFSYTGTPGSEKRRVEEAERNSYNADQASRSCVESPNSLKDESGYLSAPPEQVTSSLSYDD